MSTIAANILTTFDKTKQGNVTDLIDVVGTEGAKKIKFKQKGLNTIIRTLQAKLEELSSVMDYTAVGDGVADDTAAITLMANDLGYVVFPVNKTFRIPANFTIGVPMFFQSGSSLTIDSAATLSVNNRIISPNQWIFKGTGPVVIQLTTSTGEDAQTIKGGWFGVFPSNTTATDVTTKLQRALSSLSTQTREGTVQLECGRYRLSSTLYVPRGVQLAGRGTRRTVFDISGMDYTVFETAGNACKFNDFQFEHDSGFRTAPYIHVKHNTCDIINLHLYPSTVGIIIDELQCYIKNLRVTYGFDPRAGGDADTSLIWCRKSSFTIDTVTVLNTTYSPEHIVRVGYTSTISAGRIFGIQSTSNATPVFLDARACTITRLNIIDAIGSPSSGAQFPAVVKVLAANAFIVNQISMGALTGNAFADALLHLEASGTAIISNIVLGSSTIQSSSAYGIRLINNGSNTMRDIHVGQDVDVTGRTTRLQVVGATSGLNLPASLKGSQYTNAVVFNTSITDDAVAIVSDNRGDIFAGTLIIGSSNPAIWGMYSFRSAGSSNHVTQMVGHANMATSTGTLTGTTGTDGKFTVGINARGQLILENRIGATATISVTLLAGI